jgi:hypothetical protein
MAIFGRYGVFFSEATICATCEWVRLQYTILGAAPPPPLILAWYLCHARAEQRIAADLPVPVGLSRTTCLRFLRALIRWIAICLWGCITMGKGHPILIPST